VKSDLIKKRKRSQLQVLGQSSSRDEDEINENRMGKNPEVGGLPHDRGVLLEEKEVKK
jgi:hypothetical protein